MYKIWSARVHLLFFLLFFSKGPCLLSKGKSFVRFLAAGIKKMLKIYVSYVLFLWTHSLVMPLLESFNLIDERKYLHFWFYFKTCKSLYTSKEAGNLSLGGDRKKVRRHCLVSCHMFSELFVIGRSLWRALFFTPLTKACPSLLKNHTQQCCLPGFIALMKIWSRAQKKISGKMPEISLSQMFQQKVLACHSLM